MKTLFKLDFKNYDYRWKIKERSAVRGIIKDKDKIALIKSTKFGEYKFPGGGMNKGESKLDTLIREIKEETGLTVIEKSVIPYGRTFEISKGMEAKTIFKQTSYYFFCEITKEIISPLNLDDYEEEYGYQLEWANPCNAFKNNLAIHNSSNIPWKVRDTLILKRLLKN